MTNSAKLLRDLIDIPESVHAGDFVLKLTEGISESHAERTVREYVVTPQLADEFDKALGIIKAATETQSSHATYLDGSFGSGKSHFMAMLHAILRGNPMARGKDEIAEALAKHDGWLDGRKFLLVPYHLIGATSLDAAILGGYVSHVATLHPDVPPPAVYRDDALLADARDLRTQLGDEAFMAQLPAGQSAWRRASWDSATLDIAFDAPPSDSERRRLVSHLLASHFKRYAAAVSGTAESFIDLDEGLSVISRHAKEVLGYDVLVLLLDELVLWLAGRLADESFIRREVEKVSKLVESARWERPAPIVSFVPRQRDLRELVGRDVAGAQTATLFDTLKYWDGRFDHLKLENRNLREIIRARLLSPRDAAAKALLDEAFERTTRTNAQVWDVLLDAQGGGATRNDFRATYPFSPAFLSAMIDISEALQRQRTALKLMQELLVRHRDTLPVGQLIPLGAIYDVLSDGQDQPFTDKLREEFGQAKRFYTERLRPFLLGRHKLAEGQPATKAFRADDLVVKTLLLAALVPQVSALRSLTASRLAALNHGSIVSMIPGGERNQVARTLRELAAEFGEIRVTGTDDPSVEIALIGVDTRAILDQARHVDDMASRRRQLQTLLWSQLGVSDSGQFDTRHEIVWRGTRRVVELLFTNVRDERLDSRQFDPAEPGAIRVIIDYPFDEPSFGPAEDRHRVLRLQAERPNPYTLCWLPHFLSADRMADLGDLVVIDFVLQGDRLKDLAAHLTEDDRHHARTQLGSRRQALLTKLVEVLKKAYGVASVDEADIGRTAEQHVMVLDGGVDIRPPAALGLGEALEWICGKLLDHCHPRHPNLDPDGKRTAYRSRDLDTVWRTVVHATEDEAKRAEVAKADVPALRRIGHQLELGTMHEAHFVLRDEWPIRIERSAHRHSVDGDLPVSSMKEWIVEEQPGLPGDVVNVIIACYAAQRDRAWVRAGQVVDVRDLKDIRGDLALRAQELPSDDEFVAAGERARALFRAVKQPVRSARAVHALATVVRRRASELLPDAEALVRELERRTELLGLDTGTRLETAHTSAALTERLAGTGNDTELLRSLAAEDLLRPVEVYRASLERAKALTSALAAMEWDIIAALVHHDDKQAGTVLDRLRTAARHDEHTVALEPVLTETKKAAIELVVKTKHADETVRSTAASSARPATSAKIGVSATINRKERRRRVPVAGLEGALSDLIKEVQAEYPESTVDVTLRIVDEP